MENIAQIALDRCLATYGEIPSFLSYRNAFELMISVILSAQTTDEQVNKIAPALFGIYPTPELMAAADIADLEKIIHSTGYYRAKAKNIKGAATFVWENHQGRIPDTMDELVKIPGVGRKSAGVVLFHIYDTPAIIVDTHFGRVCRRLGLSTHEDPVKLEYDLADQLPSESWGTASMLFNLHGRRLCIARGPKCADCFLSDMCPSSAIELT